MPAACAKTSLRTGRCKWHGLQALALPWGILHPLLLCAFVSHSAYKSEEVYVQ